MPRKSAKSSRSEIQNRIGLVASIVGVFVAIIALIPAFGQWLEPREPIVTPRQPCSDIIFVGDADARIYKINTSTGEIVEIAQLSYAQLGLLAWDSVHHVIYSAAYNGDTISIIQLDPLSEIGVITQDVGWNAYSIAVNKDGQHLYASFSRGDEPSYRQIVQFDSNTYTSLNKIILTNTFGEAYLTLSRDGKFLFVSWDSYIETYFASGLYSFKRESISNGQSGRLAISPDSRYLYIAQAGELIKWNIDLGQIQSRIALPGVNGSSWIQVSSDGNIIYVGGSSYGDPLNIIYEVPASMKNFNSIEVTDPPYTFMLSNDGMCLYSASFDNGVTVTELLTKKSRNIMNIKAATGIVVLPFNEP